MTPAFKEVTMQRSSSGFCGMKLFHDNATCHVSKATKKFLETSGVMVSDHPSYSPDIAPCNFWLFGYIKQHLGDETNAESMKESITKLLRKTPHKDYIKNVQKCRERLEKCRIVEGNYFEHLNK